MNILTIKTKSGVFEIPDGVIELIFEIKGKRSGRITTIHSLQEELIGKPMASDIISINPKIDLAFKIALRAGKNKKS